MLNAISKNGGLLAGFTLITTAILSLVYWLTAPRIDAQVRARTAQLLHQVLPQSRFDNNIITSCTLVNTGNPEMPTARVFRAFKAEQPVALIVDTITPNGYSGDIRFLVSILASGKIGGVRVLEHSETPGLGDKIELRIDDWILSFEQLNSASVYDSVWAVKKDGGQFDQFTGATITPRAVVSGAQQAVKYALEHQDQLYQATADCGQEATS
ncbi:MAG: electron transport complex subunit RsxG [Aestuariibacter sp.]